MVSGEQFFIGDVVRFECLKDKKILGYSAAFCIAIKRKDKNGVGWFRCESNYDSRLERMWPSDWIRGVSLPEVEARRWRLLHGL